MTAPPLAERVIQALADNQRVLLPAVEQLVAEARAEGIREAADLGDLPAAKRVAEVLGEHRAAGGRCRCGYDPRLDWHRQEMHVAEQIIAAGNKQTDRTAPGKAAGPDAVAQNRRHRRESPDRARGTRGSGS